MLYVLETRPHWHKVTDVIATQSVLVNQATFKEKGLPDLCFVVEVGKEKKKEKFRQREQPKSREGHMKDASLRDSEKSPVTEEWKAWGRG